MIIQSYLVFPKPGQCDSVFQWLSSLSGTEVTRPTNNNEVLVLVAENQGRESEAQFVSNIQEHPFVDHIVLVSSFNETLQPH